MRLTGMLVGMKEVHPALELCHVTYLDGDGKLGESFEAMRRHLRTCRARRILVGAINDPSALGALRAMQEAGTRRDLRDHGARMPLRKDAPSCARRGPA
jgi:ribose transport system substrate-binding protein